MYVATCVHIKLFHVCRNTSVDVYGHVSGLLIYMLVQVYCHTSSKVLLNMNMYVPYIYV